MCEKTKKGRVCLDSAGNQRRPRPFSPPPCLSCCSAAAVGQVSDLTELLSVSTSPALPKHLFSNPSVPSLTLLFLFHAAPLGKHGGSHVPQQLDGGVGGGLVVGEGGCEVRDRGLRAYETLLHSLLPFCPCGRTV